MCGTLDSAILLHKPVSFVGDSPARASEAGNQLNGHYPCSFRIETRQRMTLASILIRKSLTQIERLAIL